MSKKIFFGRKFVLSTGREVDLSCEEEADDVISLLVIFNHYDSLHEITKPVSIRAEWPTADAGATLTLECRGGTPVGRRPVSESELPVEGLNGLDDPLQLAEFQELLNYLDQAHQKVRQELSQSP